MGWRPYKPKPKYKSVPLKELLHDVAVNSAQPKARVALIVEHLISVIATELLKGHKVDIHNFGYFVRVPTAYPHTKGVKFFSRKRLRDYISTPFAHLRRETAEPANDEG